MQLGPCRGYWHSSYNSFISVFTTLDLCYWHSFPTSLDYHTPMAQGSQKQHTHEKKKNKQTNKHNFRSQALTVYCNSDCVKGIGTLSLILSPVCCPCLIYYSDTISQHLLAHACTGCRVGFEMCELVAECGMAVTSALGPPTFVWAPMASEQLLFFHSLTRSLIYMGTKKKGWLAWGSQCRKPTSTTKKKMHEILKSRFFPDIVHDRKVPKKVSATLTFFLLKKMDTSKKHPKKSVPQAKRFFFGIMPFFQ